MYATGIRCFFVQVLFVVFKEFTCNCLNRVAFFACGELDFFPKNLSVFFGVVKCKETLLFLALVQSLDAIMVEKRLLSIVCIINICLSAVFTLILRLLVFLFVSYYIVFKDNFDRSN